MLVEVDGSGPRVVLVHGSVQGGPVTWARQRSLARRFELVVVTRTGFAPGAPSESCDFELDAQSIAELLDEPAHVVGHSYGGLIALLVAARRPKAVRSLTVIEPPVLSLLRSDPRVEQAISDHVERLRTHRDNPRAFLIACTELLGEDSSWVPDPLSGHLLQNVELQMRERPPWKADIDTEVLAAAPFSTLVLSGGHSPMHEALATVLDDLVGATSTHEVIRGAGHNVQRAGSVFNDRVERFFASASPRKPSPPDSP